MKSNMRNADQTAPERVATTKLKPQRYKMRVFEGVPMLSFARDSGSVEEMNTPSSEAFSPEHALPLAGLTVPDMLPQK